MSDDGVIKAADGSAFCVMGYPEDAFTEQDLANAWAVLTLPELLAAAIATLGVRPANWDDSDDQASVAAWTALDAAVRKASPLHQQQD